MERPQSSVALHSTLLSNIRWPLLLIVIYGHSSVVVYFLLWRQTVHVYTALFQMFLCIYSMMSITAGAHRLYTHKSYKATWPVRLLLVVGQTVCFQSSMYEWVRQHRVHHKFVDTDADPHNSTRGFFFSHIGWILTRKNEQVKLKGRTVDVSDLEKDPIVRWQHRFFILFANLCFALSAYIPIYFWGEGLWSSWNATLLRNLISLHCTLLVNSVAHMWGTRPYDRNLSSTDGAFLAFIALGEGWHNYHHAFPWDYKAGELGNYGLNWTTMFIDMMARLGLVSDLKVATPEMVQKRIQRTGNIGHLQHSHEGEVWGLEDKDMNEEEKKMVKVFHQDQKNS